MRWISIKWLPSCTFPFHPLTLEYFTSPRISPSSEILIVLIAFMVLVIHFNVSITSAFVPLFSYALPYPLCFRLRFDILCLTYRTPYTLPFVAHSSFTLFSSLVSVGGVAARAAPFRPHATPHHASLSVISQIEEHNPHHWHPYTTPTDWDLSTNYLLQSSPPTPPPLLTYLQYSVVGLRFMVSA